jgi:murein L,D-transpeptidase YafK
LRFLLNLLAIFLVMSMAVSGQALHAQEKTKADHVIVLKSERKLLLKQGTTTLREFRIALGSSPIGHKQAQGDGKTPEGRYIIDTRNSNSRFYRSLHISYPSAQDIARAKKMRVKPGGMIMIHGLGKEFGAIGAMHRLHDWTQGCIAVTNEEIDEIWDLVADGTPIDLRP